MGRKRTAGSEAFDCFFKPDDVVKPAQMTEVVFELANREGSGFELVGGGGSFRNAMVVKEFDPRSEKMAMDQANEQERA
jgi:hypothetical protein